MYDENRKHFDEDWKKQKRIDKLERDLEDTREELARLKLPHAIKAPEQAPDAMEERRPFLAEKISELEAQNLKLVAMNVELETENAKL